MGFVYPRDMRPDAGTSLGIARLHLGLAEIFVGNKNPKAAQFLAEHLAQAGAALDDAEAVAPGLPITSEFRGFKAWIAGDFEEAAAQYRKVRSASKDPDMRQKMTVNLAQIAIATGHAGKAREELENTPEGERSVAWHLAAARAWQFDGAEESRSAELAAAVRAAKNDSRMLRCVADASYRFGDAIALSTYEQIEDKDAATWYRIARLKITSGDTDSARSALVQLREKDPGLLDRWVERDKKFWDQYREAGLLKREPVGDAAAASGPGK